MSEVNQENRRGNALPAVAIAAINGAALIAFIATFLFVSHITFPRPGRATCSRTSAQMAHHPWTSQTPMT